MIKAFFVFSLFCLLTLSVYAMGREPVKEQINDNWIKLVVSEVVTVSLEANASTGYAWQLATPALNGIIEVVSHEYLPQGGKDKLVGVGGAEIWKFRAIKPGQLEISLNYQRAWEKNVNPVKIRKLRFWVEKHYVWENE